MQRFKLGMADKIADIPANYTYQLKVKHSNL